MDAPFSIDLFANPNKPFLEGHSRTSSPCVHKGIGGIALNKQSKWISTCIACDFCRHP